MYVYIYITNCYACVDIYIYIYVYTCINIYIYTRRWPCTLLSFVVANALAAASVRVLHSFACGFACRGYYHRVCFLASVYLCIYIYIWICMYIYIYMLRPPHGAASQSASASRRSPAARWWSPQRCTCLGSKSPLARGRNQRLSSLNANY